ncbi:hypothetical protein NECAME_03294 [Necator americanus]|nr:hypothetical protein NECAME_03294 [Necator americanus]ETN77194.1 hypothetical protein NECAME_03294 [Necator americanus]
MYILLILAAITAINLGKAFGTEKSITGKSEYALAVDVRVSVPSSAFSCMKKYGYKTVFVRGYDPTGDGKFDSNAVDNIHNANKAGLGTEVFMTPQPRSDKKGSQQLVELYEGLKNGDIKVKTIWVQVTSPVNWFPDTKINIDFLNDILSAAAHYEVKIGLYTNGYDWSQITNNAAADKIMLW